MKQIPCAQSSRGTLCSGLVFASFVVVPTATMADEDGVGFWLPGQFGSLAAAPQQPG
jgi:hypothetical protein